MTSKAEQKQRSREAIVASAAALLRERGIRGSSVLDVMTRAGLTVGGFYRHFDSKEDLFTEAIRLAAGSTWAQLVASARGSSPRERVGSVIRRYLSPRHRDATDVGCLLPRVAAEASLEGAPYGAALEREVEGFAAAVADLLGDDRESREVALGVVTLLVGALSLSRALAGTPLADDVLRAARALAERALGGDST